MIKKIKRCFAFILASVMLSGVICVNSLAANELSTHSQVQEISREHKTKHASNDTNSTGKTRNEVKPGHYGSPTTASIDDNSCLDEDNNDGNLPDEDDGYTASGMCGENVSWKLDGTGTLTISGSGPMYDYGWQGDTWVDQPYADWSTEIVNVVIEDGVTRIGDSAFEEFYSVETVVIPDSVETVGYAAFLDCCMDEVTVPKNITSIGEYAFGYFIDIEEIMLDPDFTIYGYTYSIAETYAKDNNISFNSIGVRNAPTKGKCGKLVEWSYSKSSRKLTFSGSGKMYNYGWDDVTETYRDTPWYIYSQEIEKVVFKNGIKNIGNAVLAGCWYLNSVSIPSSVTTIGEYAFNACEELEKIKLPSKATIIGEGAFDSCFSLYSINIPSKVKTIGPSAFYDCDITFIDIPKSVTNIGKKALGYFYDDDDEEEYVDADFIIKGFSDSAANTYAKKNDIYFVKNDMPKISSVKNKSGKKMSVSWKKVSGITGYQIQYSTSSKFKSAKTVTVSSYKTTSKTFSKLKKKKKYYVRIRTYRRINGKSYYSNWSSGKSVTIKK